MCPRPHEGEVGATGGHAVLGVTGEVGISVEMKRAFSSIIADPGILPVRQGRLEVADQPVELHVLHGSPLGHLARKA